MKNMINSLLAIVSIFVIMTYMETETTKGDENIKDLSVTSAYYVNSPPCVQLSIAIDKYAKEYGIPRKYAYGIAHEETGYTGILHWNYDHAQTSSVGALGPMQVMYATANGLFPDKDFSRDYLKTNIDFNVECSMKLLKELHDGNDDWKKTFGAYNTGKQVINDYAINVYNYEFE